jgi:hypothetical protein
VMKYKKLIVAGCSYTENFGSWAYILSSFYKLELINLAIPGAGNKHILFSLISYLAKNNIDPETTLIGIMWSHPFREDHIVENNPTFKDQSIYRYSYDTYTRLVLNGDLLHNANIHNYFLRTLDAKDRMLGNYNFSGKTLETWTYTESTIAYLLGNNFTFFQTNFQNYLTGSDIIKYNTNFEIMKEYHYLKELERLNLKHNIINRLELDHTQYLGEYAYHHNLLDTDKIHPSKDGHIKWTFEILIPKLQQINIL